VKKPSVVPSVEKNGADAPSVPLSARIVYESMSRTYNCTSRGPVPTHASRWPSGLIANDPEPPGCSALGLKAKWAESGSAIASARIGSGTLARGTIIRPTKTPIARIAAPIVAGTQRRVRAAGEAPSAFDANSFVVT
jgi:hypothetical protein